MENELRSSFVLILHCNGIQTWGLLDMTPRCGVNERWCSLHCFQYNAMYQTPKGNEVHRPPHANKLHIDLGTSSIAICNFWIWTQVWNVLNPITAPVCRHKLTSRRWCWLLLPDGVRFHLHQASGYDPCHPVKLLSGLLIFFYFFVHYLKTIMK